MATGIITNPGHELTIDAPVAGSLAEAAAIQYQEALAVKLEAPSDARFWSDGLFATASGIINRIPMVISDDRWQTFTGNPNYANAKLLFRDVKIRDYFRGRRLQYQDWIALAALGKLLPEAAGDAETDTALVPQVLTDVLINGTSTAAADLDYDGQPFLTTNTVKRPNPLNPNIGALYKNVYAGALDAANINVGLSQLDQRLGLNGIPLKLWTYKVILLVPLALKQVADDLVKLAELVPIPGTSTTQVQTGGNTNTIMRKNIEVVVGEFLPAGAWYLISTAPAVQPFVVATPPEEVIPIFFGLGMDPQDIMAIKAGFVRFLGGAWRTSAGIIKFTYTP